MGNSVFEKIRVDNHLFVFYDGDLIYKKYYPPGEVSPSWLFNEVWPSVQIIQHPNKIEPVEEFDDGS